MALVNRGGGSQPPAEIDQGDNDVAQQGDRIVLINGRRPEDILGFPLEQRLLNAKVVDKAGGENDYAEIEVADPDGKFLAYISNMADGRIASHIYTIRVGYYWQDPSEYATVVGTPSVERADFGADDMKIKVKIHSILQLFKDETTPGLPRVSSGDPKEKVKTIIEDITKNYNLDPMIQEEGAFKEIGKADTLKAKHMKKNESASDYERLKHFAQQLTEWEEKQVEEEFDKESDDVDFDHKKYIDERRASMGYEPLHGTDMDTEIADTTIGEDLKEYFREKEGVPEDKEIKLGVYEMKDKGDEEPKKYITAQPVGDKGREWSFHIAAFNTAFSDFLPAGMDILSKKWGNWSPGEVKELLEERIKGLDVTHVALTNPGGIGAKNKHADVTVRIPDEAKLAAKGIVMPLKDELDAAAIKELFEQAADTSGTFAPSIKNVRQKPYAKASMEEVAGTLGFNSKADRGILENALTGASTLPGPEESWKSKKARISGLKGFEMVQNEWVVKLYGTKLFFGRRQKWQDELMHKTIPVYQWRHGNYSLYSGKARYTQTSKEDKGLFSWLNIGKLLGGNEQGDEEKVVNTEAINEGLGEARTVSPLEEKLQSKTKNIISDKVQVRLNDISPHKYQGELDVIHLKAMVSRDLEMQEVEVVGSPFLRADNFVALDFNFMDDWGKPMLFTNIYIITKVTHQLDSDGILKTKLTGEGQAWDNTAGLLQKFYGVPDSLEESGGGNMITNMISKVF